MRRQLQAETYATPKGGRCASCGSDDRVELYQVGAIEGGTPLCRACAAKVKAAKLPSNDAR